jgi:hypothetical protein
MKKGEEVTLIPEKTIWALVVPTFNGPSVAGVYTSRSNARGALKLLKEGRLVKLVSLLGEVQ